jgi:cytochrome b6-f complex iron-sulfur subunit
MDRKEFLAQLGLGAAFVLTATCMNSCKNTTTVDAVDFTLDLTAAANAALLANGGYVVSNNAVVAKTTAGVYVAATVKCSHEGLTQIYYDKTANTFHCSAHGAQFSLTGAGVSGPSSGGLTIFKTTLTGNSLRIYS